MGLAEDNWNEIQSRKAMSRDWTYPGERAEAVSNSGYQQPSISKTLRYTWALDDLKKDWAKEYASCVKDGEVLFSRDPFYIAFPEVFEEKMDGILAYVDISDTDRAWLKNTWELVQKYSAQYAEKLAEHQAEYAARKEANKVRKEAV